MAGTTDTVKAILTPGEFVIRKEAVDMIGVPTLEKLNDMPEAGGHSEIDRLIGMATLKNMTGMYGGGMVNAKQYGHGGMVNKYEDGGQAMSNLKPVPDNNPGLAKLPEDVRNKMGYMQDGGMAYIDPVDSSIVVKSPEQSKMFKELISNISFPSKTSRKSQLETLIDILNNPDLYGMNKKDSSLLDSSVKNMELEFYKDILESPKAELKEDSLMGMMKGGKAKKKKEMYGYQDGGEILGLNITPESVFQAVYQMPTDDGERYYLGEAQRPLPNLSRQISIKRARDKAMNAPQDSITFDMAQQILNPEEEKGGFLKKLLGMQEGGAVQEDAMMQQYLQSLMAQQPQANPFVPFDQRPPSSGEVMSSIPKGMEQGDYYMSLKNELEMENEELLRDKVQNTFDRIRLDSLFNEWKKSAERIENLPEDTSGFIPTVPMFKPEGMGI